MSSETGHSNIVSMSYFDSRLDVIKNAEEIAAVMITRDPGTHPSEPLRVTIDRTTLDHLGLQPGDPITLSPTASKASHFEGKFIIRKARPGELAFLVEQMPILTRSTKSEGVDPTEMHGLEFEWYFPVSWVETYFPGRYDGEDHDYNSSTERYWKFSEVQGQRGEIELPLGPEELFLYLQRTSATPTTLDVHVIPGLLNQKGWTRSTPLVFESATGFDPFATEDILTIRENSLGEEPNLEPTSDTFLTEVNLLWLDRFFPDHYDALAEREAAHSDCKFDLNHIDEKDSSAQRDTLVVEYHQMAHVGHHLSFKIRPPYGK